MGARRGHRAAATTAIAMMALVLTGCLPMAYPPDVLSDPAKSADVPSRHRGDRRDREALETVRRRGGDVGTRREPASDERVVRETLRIVTLAWDESGDSGLRNARLMILRRRPQAAYVALGEAMLAADPRVREGAAWVFARLDARMRHIVEPGHVPPWAGPEREVVLSRLETLLGDPDRDVRHAAAVQLECGLGGPRRPSWATVLGHVERETDLDVKEELLRLLATREAPAADRLATARLHATDWIQARAFVRGLVVPGNQALLEREFAAAGRPLRVAILKEAEDLPPPQPWLAGLVQLGLIDPDEGVHLNAAHVQRTVVSPAPGNGGFRRPAKA